MLDFHHFVISLNTLCFTYFAFQFFSFKSWDQYQYHSYSILLAWLSLTALMINSQLFVCSSLSKLFRYFKVPYFAFELLFTTVSVIQLILASQHVNIIRGSRNVFTQDTMNVYAAKTQCLFECADQDSLNSFSVTDASLDLIRKELEPLVQYYLKNERLFLIIVKLLLVILLFFMPSMLCSMCPAFIYESKE